MSLEIKRLSAALGAEVVGLDLSQRLDASTVATLREAWLEHLVLVFRGQKLRPDEFIRFSSCFGTPYEHLNQQSELVHPEFRELLVIKNHDVGGKVIRFGQQWHSDNSYTTLPALASVLYCRVLPEVGGDTMWANMYKAYETLSEPVKRLIDGLKSVHDVTNGNSHRGDREDIRVANMRRNPPVVQPVVRVHPETGRKALFVSEWMSTRMAGMSDIEGDAILEMLFKYSTQPEFVYRHQWRVDDVLIWDNRCTIHQALRDYTQPREMLRTTLIGSECGELLWPRAKA
jgi:taurine dioxygenase